jgi:hypothetical protein
MGASQSVELLQRAFERSVPEAAEAIGRDCSILAGDAVNGCACGVGPIKCGLVEQGRTAKTCTLRAKDGRLAELPSSGAQRFERTDAASGIVRVDADTGSKATPAEASDARFARASVVADAADPEIRALAERALEGVPDSPVAKADALRAAVFRHLSRKNLASGFATASECVRSRAGDCTEHAVLLCALLRTQGIPARVASGLLYVAESGAVRNSYGWHMWTQALIDGSWVDLDAVLPGSVRFDASHVLTGTSPADGGSLDTDLARIVDLMGDTEIEVRSIDGRPAAKGAKR